ncbi:hypothetical protein [Streptomyces cadmiisoli]|uniref:Uncharacterized protein n=1 Tax=Streptomyces cadmiisoli TaxID=2184053 RepID=A0A2Z4J9P3_9ACTN|nr:hypothetical protein [Streptomyces cadmiisoli]AWW41942.1 hypothetical protein DN051_39410 [Streptomyces cadmiisoli]
MEFFLLLVLGGLVWLVVAAVRKTMSPVSPGRSRDSEARGVRTSPVPLRSAEPRDIPPLFPDFYHGVLFAVGKEPSPQNLLALIEYVGQMLAINAVMWFQQTGDTDAHDRFMELRVDDDRKLEMLPDDMIDFLWAWRPSTHQALRDWMPELEQMLTGPDSRLWNFGDELPFGIWEMED